MLVKFAKEVLIRSAFNLSQRGKHEDAIKKYDKILKNDPEYAHAIYGKASCLITLGKFNEARPCVDELICRCPDNNKVIEMKSALERNLHLMSHTTDQFSYLARNKKKGKSWGLVFSIPRRYPRVDDVMV